MSISARLAAVAAAAVCVAAAAQPPGDPAPAKEPEVKQPEKQPAETKPPEAKPAPVKTVTADGLGIEDLVVGDGVECKPGAAVVAHYKGTLKSDGSEFDSSYKRNSPAAFSLNRWIKGSQEGIPGMRVGGKRKLTVPYALAFGEAGRPPTIPPKADVPIIPPKADLVYEIELVNVLQIEDIKVGEGAECKPGATVTVHYKGTLLAGGTEFDSSYARGAPSDLSLDKMVPGWQWGIPGMKIGGKRKLIVPWQMAYGEPGRPPRIPGKSDLVFEVELVGLK